MITARNRMLELSPLPGPAPAKEHFLAIVFSDKSPQTGISIGGSLKNYLKSRGPIATMIGVDDNARIYELKIKQGVSLPSIRYEIFRGSSNQHLSGISGIATNRIQIDAYAETEEDAYRLAELIRLAPLQMFRGDMAGIFVNNVNSNGGYESGHEPVVHGSSTIDRYFVSRDYIFTYQEPVA